MLENDTPWTRTCGLVGHRFKNNVDCDSPHTPPGLRDGAFQEEIHPFKSAIVP